jgi:hypothetical protein
LSSGESVEGCSFFGELLVAKHGPEDVHAPAGEGGHGLAVAFTFGALAVVVGLGGGAGRGCAGY